MAKNRGSKDGIIPDSPSNMPPEQKANDSVKKKIAKIFDMFPQLTKETIAKILQYSDEDESRAIDAIYADGGHEALTHWADTEKAKNKGSKNKKKKKKPKKDGSSVIAGTASFDADDSSSLHSGGNADNDVEKETSRAENGDFSEVANEDTNRHSRVHTPEINPPSNKNLDLEKSPQLEYARVTVPESSTIIPFTKNNSESTARGSPSSDTTDDQSVKKDKFRSITDAHHKQSQRQRTSSFRRSKTSSQSEEGPSQHSSQVAATPTKRGYDRCKKDLNRQAISLQRIQLQMEKALDESNKKMKHVFTELQKMVEQRQREVELELEKTKQEAFNLLRSRQDLAVELKRRVDRTSQLTESEWSDLRSDIKQFVTERKYDDDLGKIVWFQWTDLSEVIKTFGEVQPVKNVYTQRTHSILGNSEVNTEPTSPTSSIANEDLELPTEKNDEASTADNLPNPIKNVAPPYNNRSQYNENRTRIYSNKTFRSNYSNNNYPTRGGAQFRGNRGGYTRPYKNDYYGYSNEGYRGHPNQERFSEGHYSNRNTTNPRDGKNENYPRQRNQHQRSNFPRHRGANRQRQDITTDALQNPPTTDKVKVTNGFPAQN